MADFQEGALAKARRKRIEDAIAAAENGTEGTDTNANSKRNQDLNAQIDKSMGNGTVKRRATRRIK